jgi:hypothetical protein
MALLDTYLDNTLQTTIPNFNHLSFQKVAEFVKGVLRSGTVQVMTGRCVPRCVSDILDLRPMTNLHNEAIKSWFLAIGLLL